MKIKTTVEKVNEAIDKINEVGSCLVYKNNSGSFSVKGVEGRFTYEDGTLSIVIDDKPCLASDSMIENEIRKFIN